MAFTVTEPLNEWLCDGISAAEKLSKNHIAPVVLLTAFSQKELVERASEAGALAYVVKPFTPNDLLPAIEIALARYERAESVAGIMALTFFDDLADDAYLVLTRVAMRCGHDLGSPSETVLDFSIRRTRAFERMTGKAA